MVTKNFNVVIFDRCAILSAITYHSVKGIKFELTGKSVGDQMEISLIGRTMKEEFGKLIEDGFTIEPKDTPSTTIPKPENDFVAVYFESEKIINSLRTSRTQDLTLRRFIQEAFENLELVNANPAVGQKTMPALIPQIGQSNPPIQAF